MNPAWLVISVVGVEMFKSVVKSHAVKFELVFKSLLNQLLNW